MKKNGFTLAELMVTIGIIGIVAAITIPLMSNIMPNKEKLMVLKYYTTLNNITKELLDDPALYPGDSDINACLGFNCTGKTLVEVNGYYASGSSKFASLFLSKLKNSASGLNHQIGSYMIGMPDGYTFMLKPTEENPGLDHKTIVIILANSSKSHKTFNEDQEKYGSFIFNIDSVTGQVTPGDALTQAFIENADNVKGKKADIKRARQILGLDKKEEPAGDGGDEGGDS